MWRSLSTIALASVCALLAAPGARGGDLVEAGITKLLRDRIPLYESAMADEPCCSVEAAELQEKGLRATVDTSDPALGRIQQIEIPALKVRYDKRNEMIAIDLGGRTYWFQSTFAPISGAVELPDCPKVAGSDLQMAAVRGSGGPKCR